MGNDFKGNFRLTHGCIREDNSITSRDVASPEYFATQSKTEDSLSKQSRFYNSIGYKIWWSNIKRWNPEKEFYETPKSK